jgi:murein DD-endopeptidase MepM/ murein hydrolase activator NlpD
MPRCRPLAAAVVVAAVLLGSGTPLSARPDHGSRQDPVAAEDPVPTRPSTAPPSTVPPSTVPTGIDVGHGGDQAGAVPPAAPHDVEPVDPDNASQVLQIDTEEAEARRDEARAALDALKGEIRRKQADLAAFESLSDDLVVQQRLVARRAVRARRLMVERAVGAYVSGNTPQVQGGYTGADLNEVEERSAIVRTILEADQDEAHRLLARRLDITARLSRVLEQAEQTAAELAVARSRQQEARRRLRSAQMTFQILSAGSDIVITGFVFPVADPHTFSSTFGAARSGGRSHEGNDIFAPMGTPVLASESGIIANMGVGTLGGTKLWVYGESGTQYYYAHLIAYADGIVEGVHVRAGDVIGYVGNTGNAITTPPHLHFEIHPEGGDAIDPYPLLHAVDQIDGRHVLPNLYDDPRGPGL